MSRFQYLILWITLASSFFILHAVSFAQTETLTDEEYRQEAQTYMTTPCFEKAGHIMKETMDLKEIPLTGMKLLRFMNAEGLKELENEMIGHVLKNVKGEPKDNRMLWYKMGANKCLEGMTNNIHKKTSNQTQDTEDQLDSSISKKQSDSSDSVSDQAKQQAIKTCKESLQILGSNIPFSYLNFCIERELQAYQEFQQNYGD